MAYGRYNNNAANFGSIKRRFVAERTADWWGGDPNTWAVGDEVLSEIGGKYVGMEKMKMRKWNHILSYGLIVCYFVLMLLLHLKMSVVSDDIVFKDNLTDSTVIQFMQKCYLYINGRIFTDPLGAVLVAIPFTAWKVLDSGICTVAYYMIDKLLADKDQILEHLFVFLVMLMYPVYYLMSAGFIMTSTNYLYTSFGILCIAVALKWTRDRKFSVGSVVLITVASFYAANQDQSACVAIALLLAYAVYLVAVEKGEKRVVWMTLYALICVCAGFALLWFSPGHIARSKSVEGTFCVPGYADWSVATKLFKGYTTTAANLLYYPTWIYVMLCVLVCVLGMLNKKWIMKGIATIPLLFCLGSYYIWSHSFSYYPTYGFGMADLLTYDNPILTVVTSLLPLVLFLFLCFAVLDSCESKLYGGTIVLLLSIGLASRVAMGFSASLFGSSFRTFTYLLLLMQVDCVLIFKEILRKNNKMACVLILLVAAGLAAYMYVFNQSVLDVIAEEGFIYYIY